MKTLKKTLCLVLAVVMVVGVLVLPASADYKDVADIDKDFTTAVTSLESWKVMLGDDNGNFKPEAAIQRQEMAAIVYRLLTGDVKDADGKDNSAIYAPLATAKFTDVGAKDWAAGYIGYCADKGIIVGTNAEGTTFEPTRNIPGYDVLCMLLRALGYGKNKEYQGADWAKNIAADATRLGLTKGITTKLNIESERQEVAQMTYQAAQAARVTWSDAEKDYIPYRIPNDPNSDKNISLVQTSAVAASAYELDVWGIPSGTAATTKVTFTYPVPATGFTIPAANAYPMLYESWVATPECDVAAALKELNEVDAAVFTNGYESAEVDYITPTNMVDTIGEQGRHTRIYNNPYYNGTTNTRKYLVAYVDTYLAVVDSVSDMTKDAQGHVITPAKLVLKIYGNNGSNNTPVVSTYTAESKTANYTYTKGQKLAVNVALGRTATDGVLGHSGVATTLTSTNVKKLEVAGVLSPVAVTVKGIVRDSTVSNVIGFTGTDGKTYLYNYTFAGTASAADNRLQTVAVGGTYNVWTDAQGNVLDLAPTTASGNVGVIIGAAAKNVGLAQYAIEYTVLLANGTTTTILVKNTGDVFFNSAADAETAANSELGNRQKLVKYTVSGGYATLTRASLGNPTVTDANGDHAIMNGDAEALSTTNLVDDNTVFFVANYSYSNSQSAYVYQNISITTGFKSISDLKHTDGDFSPAPATATMDDDIYVTYINNDSDAEIEFVLVLYANAQVVPNTYTVPNYAYLVNTANFEIVEDDYHIYKAILNGQGGNTLTVTNAAALTASRSDGLYTYANTQTAGSTNAWNTVVAAGSKSATGWSYKDGVLTAQAAVPTLASGTETHLAVASNCAVYVVNPTTGNCYSITLTELNASYTDCAISWQYNANNYVSLIYVTAIAALG